ncbi:hypothetical protein DHEL01_v212841 [Diaporthe helianthi]|uniref:Uncharacterized protein n=1 Tax=Diaporthe helianthi TaxID=158607 RepID=A0A2P5HET4_DIAHE|nr:hypothetical protein DHEL01_v212841 [Diaporthe helianthi]
MGDRPDCGYCNVCTKRWAPTGLGTVLDVMKNIRQFKGQPTAPPGPRSCSRIACSSSCRTWLCNDSDEEMNLDSWDVVANAVEDITRQCWWREKDSGGTGLYDVTGGQIFQPDGWNVIVMAGDDSC